MPFLKLDFSETGLMVLVQEINLDCKFSDKGAGTGLIYSLTSDMDQNMHCLALEVQWRFLGAIQHLLPRHRSTETPNHQSVKLGATQC